MSSQKERSASGVGYAAAAYLWWGIFPLYFHALSGIPAPEILSHRIIWSAVYLVCLISFRRSWPRILEQLRAPGILRTLAVTAVLISSNWLAFIWAVNSGHALEASLGYFVNPLVTVAFGVVFLKDRLTSRQALAIALASAGVLALVVRAGRVPWVALALAMTFASYGLLRKRLLVEPVAGLLGEVALLLPAALLHTAWIHRQGATHFGSDARQTLLLVLSGVATSVPLIWFAKGVERLRLSTIGLLQYLNPSIQFATAVFVFGEIFTSAYAIAFGCIWLSLAIYTSEALALTRRPAAAS